MTVAGQSAVPGKLCGNVKVPNYTASAWADGNDRKDNNLSDNDEKTLCALQEEGFIESNTNAFKILIQPAAHFCRGCGRSAVSDKNLCKPEKL